ncbi:hypothetical protein [Microcoleus sp. A2-C2]|uniref:hypothetical protein n=1 Tax=Microcoleus sp. A2-C2 TaxID=2818530 RepID=UPI002FD0A1B5
MINSRTFENSIRIKMGSNTAANKRFDDAMKACGISDDNDRDRNIRTHFHRHLENHFSDTKDEMEYRELLKEAKTFIRENYPHG